MSDRQPSDQFGAPRVRVTPRGARRFGAVVVVAALLFGLVALVRSRSNDAATDRHDACQMLDRKTVDKLGDRKAQAMDHDAGPLGSKICIVSFEVGTEELKLYVVRDGGKPLFESAAGSSRDNDRFEETGIGDEAVWLRQAQAMVVRSGADTFTVITREMSGSEDEHKLIARRLAPSIIERLRKTPPPAK